MLEGISREKKKGAEWREKDRPERDGTDGGKKDVYYAGRDEGEKKKGSSSGVKWPTGGTLPRGAKPCRRRRQGGKEKAGKRAKSVHVLYAYFFLFFLCIFTNTKRDDFFVYIFMYT